MSTRRVDPQAALPDTRGDIRVDGLHATVTVERDAWGIPHIRAGSVHDALFAQGFVTAQDRLWQMDYDRRRATGRLAEILGESGLGNDLFARRARLHLYAETGLDGMDPATRSALEAYAAGVNAFLASSDARPVELQALDYEPEPWRPSDTIAVFLARHILFASWLTKLFRARVLAHFGARAALSIRREGAAGDATALIVPPGATGVVAATESLDTTDALDAARELQRAGVLGAADDGETGSNSWGLMCAEGPVIAGDSHRALEIPNVYSQIEMSWDGGTVAGFAFPGVPGVPHFGHNGNVSWCVTNASADYQDVFVERLAGDAAHVVDGREIACDVRDEIITVRAGEPVRLRTVATHRGPVVLGGPPTDVAVSLRSTGLIFPGGSLRCVLPLMHATTSEEAIDALSDWVEPVNSFVIADRHTVSYTTAGCIPVHGELAAWFPVPGWRSDYDWQSTIAPGELPRHRAGVIVTANNRIRSPDRPLLGVDYASGVRAARVRELLDKLPDPRASDMPRLHADAASALAQRALDAIAAIGDEHLDEPALSARRLLAGWDGMMARDSAAAALYAQTRAELVSSLAAQPHLQVLRGLPRGAPPPGAVSLEVRLARSLWSLAADPGSFVLPDGATWDELWARALSSAWNTLLDTLGPEPAAWRWGALHRARPAHPLRSMPELRELLAIPDVELDGDADCVCATISRPGVSHHCTTGPVTRYVFDMCGDTSAWIVPLGASGHPASPHFADQIHAWANARLVPVRSQPQVTQRLIADAGRP